VIKTNGLAHISFYVADLERATRFYQQVFGLELLREHRGPIGADPEGRQISLSTPGQNDIITLMQAKAAPVGPGGFAHFAFILNDDSQLDAAITEVEQAGGKLIKRGQYEEAGIVENFAYVADLDGYVIELNAQKVLLSNKKSPS
jgi:catechol 2,3-dioxygenase-like lactoylglutathione lyase family enzyme